MKEDTSSRKTPDIY